MTYTVELKNEHALRLLEELEQLGVLTIQNARKAAISSAEAPTPKEFTAMSYSTKDFKFNRDEANER